MKNPVLISFFLLLLGVLPLLALEILSISPATVQSGDSVRVTGGPFDLGLSVRIGMDEVTPVTVRERELLFTVPPLPAGEYVLSVLHNGIGASRTLVLRILDSPPLIHQLIPQTWEACSGLTSTRMVVEGERFSPGSALLLDGKPAPSQWESAARITLLIPPLAGGVHEVQIISPNGLKSLARAFLVEDRPEIFTVHQGEDRVNSYELILQGKNFFASSVLLANGTAVGRDGSLPVQTGQLRYLDCNTLVYVRYPYSRTPKPVVLQVINPNGGQSNVFSISVP